MKIVFTKMQGLGNDFVVIDATKNPFQLNATDIQRMADRRYGVGFDQLLLIEPGTKEADFTYRIFNADGSSAEQCGNGARCVTKYIIDSGLASKKNIVLQAPKGLMHCVDCGNDQYQVDMDVPVISNQSEIFNVNGVDISAGILSIGNPHVVIVVDDVATADVSGLGEALSNHVYFPNRTNVEFVQIQNRNRLLLRVYERGVGETLACGSGACAAMVMARVWGLIETKATVSQPGGDLVIEWADEGVVRMTGPAEMVFVGEWGL